MNVPLIKLGLEGIDEVDILNLKCPPEVSGLEMEEIFYLDIIWIRNIGFHLFWNVWTQKEKFIT